MRKLLVILAAAGTLAAGNAVLVPVPGHVHVVGGPLMCRLAPGVCPR